MTQNKRIRRSEIQESKSAVGSNVATPPALRPGIIGIALVVTVGVGFGFYWWQTRGVGTERVVNTGFSQKPRELEPVVIPTLPAVAKEQNAERLVAQSNVREQGVPIPETLLRRPDRTGKFWYVGEADTDSLVEIPFPPGKKPGAPPKLDPVLENPGFLGAQACQSCHRDRYDTFIHTAHHLSSQLPTAETIAGSFDAGKNEMRTKNPNVHFTMLNRDGRFIQKVSFYGWEFEIPIDFVIGSSKLGQAYLYWDFDALYQTHVTHVTEANRWINSPGYLDGDAVYSRPIRSRCLECHSTYVDSRDRENHFTPGSLILGISCERCHGPGKPHVDHHTLHPEDKKAQFVTVPTDLTRQQQLDVCGQCHSGSSSLIAMPYSFRPGNRLEDHYQPADEKSIRNSVHASNQATRLAQSKCFQNSQMACADCHNLHQLERGQLKVFSTRCMKCHETQDCGMAEKVGEKISDNCIDCHMPKEATLNMQLDSMDGNVFPPLRDHFIHLDNEATQEFLKNAGIE